MSMRDLIEGEVEVDDEENDDSFDEETGEVRPRKQGQNGHIDDSSEEEDDDDDEEAARAVRLPARLPCAPITDFLLGPRGFHYR
jgi:transcription elongation factor SPT6